MQSLASLYYTVFCHDKFVKMINEIRKISRSDDDVSISTKTKFLKWKKHAFIFVIITVITAIATSLLLNPYSESRAKMFLAVWFFDHFVKPINGEVSEFFKFMYFLSFMQSGFIMMGQIYGFIYMVMGINMQNHILLELISNIDKFETKKEKETNILLDKEYQEYIYQRFLYCIKMHEKIKRQAKVFL